MKERELNALLVTIHDKLDWNSLVRVNLSIENTREDNRINC